MKDWRLINQLKKSGAEDLEAKQMSAIAKQLASPKQSLGKAKKALIAESTGFKTRRFHLQSTTALAGALAIFVIMIIVAQSAQPGSVLYALKRKTEQIRAHIDPNYNKEIVERRKAELDNLKKSGSDDSQINQAENELRESQSELDTSTQTESGGESEPGDTRDSDNKSGSIKTEIKNQEDGSNSDSEGSGDSGSNDSGDENTSPEPDSGDNEN